MILLLNKFYTILRISFLVLYTTSASFGSDQFITLQSTSSVRDSGLLKFILPKFTDQYHVKVKVIANGTGQAIKNAKDCNGDLLLVHSKQDEIDFVNQGYGIKRYDLMYNDFIIVGPADNNLNINANNTLSEVLTKISVSILNSYLDQMIAVLIKKNSCYGNRRIFQLTIIRSGI